MSTSLPEFLTNIKLFDKFHDKKIDLTDEDRNILTPLTYPIKPGTRFLIREYLPKKT
ncbi:MAG: hypothetical protein WCG98_10895 [bacterium]